MGALGGGVTAKQIFHFSVGSVPVSMVTLDLATSTTELPRAFLGFLHFLFYFIFFEIGFLCVNLTVLELVL